MKKLLSIVSLLISQDILANCYVAENFSGPSALAVDGYTTSEDGFAGIKFEIEIEIDEQKATVTPDFGTSCLAMSELIAICSGGIDGKVTTIEMYSIDVRQKKVIYVQVRNGLEAALLSDLNGAKLFIGDITGNCD